MRHTNIAILFILLTASVGFGQDAPDATTGFGQGAAGAPPVRPSGPGVAPTLAGGYVHQFSTDLNGAGAGSFSVDRFFIRPGVDLFFGPKLQASFNLGYGLDRYDFSDRKAPAEEPWDDVNTFRFSMFTRIGLDDEVSLFAVPAIGFAAEKGASLEDGFTFGMFAGASWKLSDTLTLGPGAGFFTNIEDSGSFFPIILIDWEFAENWYVRTGKGLAATRGPGLRVEWEFADQWSVAVGGRWEQLRFRLDDEGVAGKGVGEEQSIPLFLALTYELGKRSSIGLLGGVNLSGSLATFDQNGRKIDRERYDPVPFVGVAFSLTF